MTPSKLLGTPETAAREPLLVALIGGVEMRIATYEIQ